MPDPFTLPGFVDAHSHTFQRALRGRAAGGDFWSWRESMLEEAAHQTPPLVRASYEATYLELRAAGYTAVGEFHYLGVREALAAHEAAAAAGVALVLVHVAYARGGLPRFRQESVPAFLAEVEQLRQKMAPKVAALEERIRKAEQAVLREKEQSKQSIFSAALSFGSSVLGAFMGRKVISATNISKAATAYSANSRFLMAMAATTPRASGRSRKSQIRSEKNSGSMFIPMAADSTSVALGPGNATGIVARSAVSGVKPTFRPVSTP